MSNPTANFGWQMPTPTDLVTDLPADFEVFGQAVDTSLADLRGGTTGQILSKTSNTDMDFTWTSANPGDITGVTAGTGISGGGTSGDVTITNSMATAIDAKGDLIVGTGADAFSRLAIGATNGHVLTVDSAEATGLKYAAVSGGGMTLLSTTTLSGATTTISSISQAYNSLFLIMFGVTAAGNGIMRCAPNGSTTTTTSTGVYADGGSPAFFSAQNSYLFFTTGGWDGTNSNNSVALTINNYTSSTNYKSINHYGYFRNASGDDGHYVIGGGIETNTAITSLVFSQAGGNLSTGTVLLYGVK